MAISVSRRRYVSTLISIDKNVNTLATRDEFAALLYTWMIPHAEDDASITGDPEELLFTVIPGRRDKTAEDVESALVAMAGLDLIARDNGTVYFDSDSFYKYQTYVPPAKRADNSAHFHRQARISEEQRETPKKAASPSPSPSPSPSKTLPATPRKSSLKKPNTCDGNECLVRQLRCGIRGDIEELTSRTEATSLYGGNSDLSKTMLKYAAKVCELCQTTFGEYDRPDRDAKCAAVLRAAITRIRASRRTVDNLPAYLNGELKRMQQLGDVCGDDLVAELRQQTRPVADAGPRPKMKALS